MVKRAGFGVWGEAPEAGRASVHVADGPEGGVRRVVGRLRRQGVQVCVQPTPSAVKQKLMKHCKSIILR